MKPSGSPLEGLASEAPKCLWRHLVQVPPKCDAEDTLETIVGATTHLALVGVSRADDGESGIPPDVAPTGPERRFVTGGGSFSGGAPTIADLMLPKSAIIACLKRLWVSGDDAWRSCSRHRTTSSPSPSAVLWAGRKHLVWSRSMSTSSIPTRIASWLDDGGCEEFAIFTRQAGLFQSRALGNHQLPTTQDQTEPTSIPD